MQKFQYDFPSHCTMAHIPADSTESAIDVKTISEYATIENGDNSAIGLLSITSSAGVEETTVEINVIAENGASQTYYIKLIKISKDNTIKEIFVNDTLVEKDGDGNYIAEVEESNIEAIVKVVANNEYASIQIEKNAQEIKQSEKTVELSKEKYTNVLIKVTSQNGEIMQETLTIKKVSDDNTINTVLVDGIECKNYDETTKTYTAYIDAKNVRSFRH